jgi:hypothetical protein
MAGGIFISYRRDDAKHAAGRLVDRLSQAFGPHQLFLDVDNIAPGLDFKKVLSEKVQGCDVLLAVIGPGWLASTDERGARRLDNPKDFVRIEIEAALARDIRVIPVLVDGARMPGEQDLPDTLRPLADRNAVRLAHERFGADAGNLTMALAKVVVPARKGWFAAAGPRASLNVTRSATQMATGGSRGNVIPIVAAMAFAVAAAPLSVGWMSYFEGRNWNWLKMGFIACEMASGALANAIFYAVVAVVAMGFRKARMTMIEVVLYWLSFVLSIFIALRNVADCLIWDWSLLPGLGTDNSIGVMLIALSAIALLSGIAFRVWRRRRVA